MQQFWYTIKKVYDTKSYEFFLANKKYTINAEVFWTILNIFPRVEGVDFTDAPDNETTLTFLIDLGYKGPLNRHTNMFVDHMHQPWRTLASIINKENVDYPDLIWEDFAYQIDYKKEERSRRENMPYPRFTKIIINHFLKQHKSLTNLNHKHYHTIKDDGIISRLKFVIISEDYQEYELPIPDVMLTDAIKHSKSYQMFIKYSINQIPHKKISGNGSKGKKTADESQETIDKKSGGRSSKSIVIQDTPSAPKLKPATSKSKLKGAPSLTLAEQEAANIMQALKERTGTIPGVPDESTVISDTSSKGTGIKPGVPDEEKDITEEKDNKDGDADDEGDDHISDTQDADDEDIGTKSDEDDIYEYKIRVRKDEDVEMKDAKVKGYDKGNEDITDAAKEEAENTSEAKDDTKKTELPPSSSSLSIVKFFEWINLLQHETPRFHLNSIEDPHNTYHSPYNKQQHNPTPKQSQLMPTIITDVPESNALTDVELRVTKLEKVVDSYLDTKVRDVFQKELQKHMADLIHKYSLQHLPELTKKPTLTAEQ
ncbi:hypothetical protein Tco_0538376 [Tanacetum coccineum]